MKRKRDFAVKFLDKRLERKDIREERGTGLNVAPAPCVPRLGNSGKFPIGRSIESAQGWAT